VSQRLVFLGPPGAGKGTQAQALAREWGVPHVATGDMLREAVAAGTRLGDEARRYMESGALVPDEVIIGLIAERFRAPDAARGFVLDGFPRTIAQADALERLLKDREEVLDRVVFFEISEAELLRRLTGRRVCGACGALYHVVASPPRQPDVCDRCGGVLQQRADDGDATVRKRLDVYRAQTAPLLAHYEALRLLVRVPAQGPVEEVRAAIRSSVEPAR
jgi:adenylate kinase